jgi:hypothetical protein
MSGVNRVAGSGSPGGLSQSPRAPRPPAPNSVSYRPPRIRAASAPAPLNLVVIANPEDL